MAPDRQAEDADYIARLVEDMLRQLPDRDGAAAEAGMVRAIITSTVIRSRSKAELDARLSTLIRLLLERAEADWKVKSAAQGVVLGRGDEPNVVQFKH